MSDTNESPTVTASRPDNPVRPSQQADRTGEGRVNANKKRPVQQRGGRGCNKFIPVLGGNWTKIAHTGDIFGEPPGGIISIRSKFVDHVGDHVVLSPEGAVLVTFPGMESSHPRPPQSLNNSEMNPRR